MSKLHQTWIKPDEMIAEIDHLHMVVAAAEKSAKNAAIEECARIAENRNGKVGEYIAAAIRALKSSSPSQ